MLTETEEQFVKILKEIRDELNKIVQELIKIEEKQ
jgi:hypothetical protein